MTLLRYPLLLVPRLRLKRYLKGRYGSVGTSENIPVIHRQVKNAAPVKVVQSQGDD
jgi:hypothetical protein